MAEVRENSPLFAAILCRALVQWRAELKLKVLMSGKSELASLHLRLSEVVNGDFRNTALIPLIGCQLFMRHWVRHKGA
jgi:hypothetical protein